jgi:hypothetical protein
LAFSYWIDNLGFVLREDLLLYSSNPPLGVSNWPVIYFINYTPTSSLALFNTAPSKAIRTQRKLQQRRIGPLPYRQQVYNKALESRIGKIRLLSHEL